LDPLLLDIQELVTLFPGPKGPVAAVAGLDLGLGKGEVMGLVGESGCGKTMTAMSIMGLVPPPGLVAEGKIIFQGRDLLSLSPKEMQAIRGQEIGMVFQEPMTSLNPVFTVGRQVAEALRAHQDLPRRQAWAQAVETLDRVGIPDAARRAKAFPHQLSGGMRQRVMIAMALIMKPQLIIADEPTTALDVTIQAQILGLLQDLQEQSGASVLLITHNLAVVAQTCRRVAVMYTGLLMEEALVDDIFSEPLHPYTMGLMSCLPSRAQKAGILLPTIKGVVPPLEDLPKGCAFSDRCPQAFSRCQEAAPALVEVAPGRRVRCFLHHDWAYKKSRWAA
jgi:oligopeptide/dipeptide ABC transporter ATP-binding protein